MNSDLVTLALETRRESDALMLHVVIQNRGGDDIFLRAYPGDFDNTAVRQGEAFIAVDPEPPQLRVSLLPPDPPGGISFSSAVHSLSVRLGPDERFETIIAVPTPVRPWNPYLDALGKRAVAFFPALDEVST
ncbi:MAG: hypothetical protein HKO98_09220, partial [Gemmatimonadetes bacterium]|nr:hypothetical protein [Gemmatimonadota bacterium]